MKLNLYGIKDKGLVYNKSENSFRDTGKAFKSPLRYLPSLKVKHLATTSQFNNPKRKEFSPGHYSEITDLGGKRLAREIFEAKCKDLMILSVKDQETRFFKQFQFGLSLRQLNLQESNLSLESCRALSKLLPTSVHFAYLNLSGNKLTDNGVLKIAKALRKNYNIVSLDLSSTDISVSGSKEILENLSVHKSLVSLNLSSLPFLQKNRLGANEGLTKLLAIPTLTYLNLSDTGLNKENFYFLIKGLEKNHSLRFLNLSSNKLKGAIFKDFCQALTNTSVEELLLANNKIEEAATEELADFFAGRYGYGVLSIVSLAGNCLTTATVSRFLEVIVNENYLVHLNLENHRFSGTLDVLFRLMVENKRLKILNLSFCALSQESVYMMAEGLAKNNCLENLILQGNNFRDSGAKCFASALLINRSLKKLDVSSNNIRSAGGLALVSALSFNKSVTILHINDNELKDEVGEALLKLFTNNFYILQLKFDLNPMAAKFSAEISVFLDRNKKFNKEVSRKTTINLKKIIIEEDQDQEEEENVQKERLSQYLSNLKEYEMLTEGKINEVSRDSVEKINEIHREIDVGAIQTLYHKQKLPVSSSGEKEEKSEI